MMEWMTTKEAAELWGVSTRQVQILCDRGRVNGASKLGDIWVIPKGLPKPVDGRTNNGRREKKEIVNDVALGANSEMLGRYSEAGKQFKVAYDGMDNATGQELHQGLKQISEYQATSVDKFGNVVDNTQKQQGFSAEVLDTAKQNAENIKRGEKERVARTDDLGRVNDTEIDQVTLDEFGNIIAGSEVQMKFLKDADAFSNAAKVRSYRQHYPDGKFRIPADQYDAVKGSLKTEIENLKNKELTPEQQEQLEYLIKVDKNLKKSEVTKAEAMSARLNPGKVTAKQILKTSNEAGIGAAKIGVAVGGGFSIIANTIAVLKGEKEVGDAIIDTVGDTAKAGVISYATGFTNTALASVMKNSSDELVRSLGKANAPAYVIQTAITTTKSLISLCKGDITVNDFFMEIGKNGTLLLTSAQGAIIGQVLIPVPVVGALVGGLVSTLICGVIYDYTVGMKLLNAEIDVFCAQLSFEISLLKEYQAQLMQLDIYKFKRDTGSYKILANYISEEYNEQDFNVMLKLTYDYIGIPCPWGEGLFDDFMQDKNKTLTFG